MNIKMQSCLAEWTNGWMIPGYSQILIHSSDYFMVTFNLIQSTKRPTEESIRKYNVKYIMDDRFQTGLRLIAQGLWYEIYAEQFTFPNATQTKNPRSRSTNYAQGRTEHAS